MERRRCGAAILYPSSSIEDFNVQRLVSVMATPRMADLRTLYVQVEVLALGFVTCVGGGR